MNLNTVGYLIVGLFFLTWLFSLLIWRYARIEQRWAGGTDGNAAPSEM